MLFRSAIAVTLLFGTLAQAVAEDAGGVVVPGPGIPPGPYAILRYAKVTYGRTHHRYTISCNEVQNWRRNSWTFENITGGMYGTQIPGTVTLYRAHGLWSPPPPGGASIRETVRSVYTTDFAEIIAWMGAHGVSDGPYVAGYVYPPNYAGGGITNLYRSGNPNTDDTFYTASEAEYKASVSNGWSSPYGAVASIANGGNPCLPGEVPPPDVKRAKRGARGK